jgi:acid phosphatase (class A)
MVMKIRTILLVFVTFIFGSLQAQQDIPDAKKFLPGPPEETSVEYLKDYAQYVWGKSQRSSSDWQQQASSDMNYQLNTYINAFLPW